ncbi:MAG: CoA transferase [Dehalococcoidia bacterium]
MTSEPAAPLDGVRIVDLTSGSAALAGRLLAGLGAEVIKVEPPGGESGRRNPPLIDGDSLAFWHDNLGKLSLQLAPGDSPLATLLDGADVVLEGGPDLVFDINMLVDGRDDLIRAAISGWGTGPRQDWKSTDLVAQAAGGMLALNGESDREPLRVAGETAHALAAHYLVGGVLLALRARRESGRGGRVEVTLQEAVASAIEPVGVRFNEDKTIVRRNGDLHWVGTYGIFRCADGYVTLAWNRHWSHLVALLASDGQEEDLGDDRYLDPATVSAEATHIRDVLGRWAATRTRLEIFERAQELRLQWAPINRPEDALQDPQLAARGFFVPLRGPGGTLPASGAPARLSRTPWQPRRPMTMFSGPFERGHRAKPTKRPATGGALAGIRVLDFTWVLAGPYGTRILADHGADVLKVQTDRKLVGYVGDGYFAAWNRNKRGIALDLDHHEARAIVRDLVRLSDVVADNFSTRVMRAWGLDDQALLAIKPDLVVAHLTGMGQSGPYEHYVSYGPTAQALAGLSALTGYPGERPLGLGFSISDHLAGLVMANAVLAALEYRDHTGHGQVIDVSQFEATASFLGSAYLEAAVGLQPTGRGNPGSPGSIGPSGVFRCRGEDRWIAVEVTTREAQQALRALVGEGDLVAGVERWASEQDADAAMRTLQAAGIAASVVADGADLVERDEGLRARGFWWTAEHSLIGLSRTDGSPIHLEAAPPPAARPSPLIGQHNFEVFGGLLGLTAEEVARLEREGALR